MRGPKTSEVAMQKSAVVCGAGGFIASHLVKRLKACGYWVRGVDIKRPEFSQSAADDFKLLDLRQPESCTDALRIRGTPPRRDLPTRRGYGWYGIYSQR